MKAESDYESHKARLQYRILLRENIVKASILIVEDDDAHFCLVQFILEREGHTVSRASDGMSGLEQAQKEQPDLVLMDMRLPVMSGWEVARRLRAMPEMQSTPIIGISATVDLQRKAREAGCEEFLLKPFSPRTLNDLVHKYTHRGLHYARNENLIFS